MRKMESEGVDAFVKAMAIYLAGEVSSTTESDFSNQNCK
jgi:hypothetical protein